MPFVSSKDVILVKNEFFLLSKLVAKDYETLTTFPLLLSVKSAPTTFHFLLSMKVSGDKSAPITFKNGKDIFC